MASLDISEISSLEDAFKRITEIPFSVTAEALDDMAEIAMVAVRSAGESMGVRDPESDVHILDKMKAGKAKQTESGGYKLISFTGKRRRGNTETRNAEIAFVNEYGKRGQKARPFILTGLQRSEDRQIDSAGKTILDWVEKEFKR